MSCLIEMSLFKPFFRRDLEIYFPRQPENRIFTLNYLHQIWQEGWGLSFLCVLLCVFQISGRWGSSCTCWCVESLPSRKPTTVRLWSWSWTVATPCQNTFLTTAESEYQTTIVQEGRFSNGSLRKIKTKLMNQKCRCYSPFKIMLLLCRAKSVS